MSMGFRFGSRRSEVFRIIVENISSLQELYFKEMTEMTEMSAKSEGLKSPKPLDWTKRVVLRLDLEGRWTSRFDGVFSPRDVKFAERALKVGFGLERRKAAMASRANEVKSEGKGEVR